MSQLFEPKRMATIDSKDWKEVVKKGVELLVNDHKATPKLADAIFESTKKFGAYYVLEKGLALLHAAPSDYALENSTSVMVAKDYVTFNNQEDKSAKIIITLSAVDDKSHMNLLVEFSKFFMNDDFKKEAFNAKDHLELLEIVKKYENKI